MLMIELGSQKLIELTFYTAGIGNLKPILMRCHV